MKQNIYLIIILLVFIGVGSCKKWIAVSPPTDAIVTATVFNNNTTATQALLSIYRNVNAESYNMSYRCGLLSDEFKNYSPNGSGTGLNLYTNHLISTDLTAPWSSCYQYIYRSNDIIEGLQKYDGVSSGVKQQLIGEAKFMRAFYHFYLTNCYGDVPVVTSTDYTINGVISRSPKALVFAQIINDLQEAKTMININYVDATDTSITTERVRPTRSAASALLARAYLYTEKYDSAEALATEVINHTDLYQLVNDPNAAFLSNSSEAIWQIPPTLPALAATTEGANYILIAAPNGNKVTISQQLFDSFEDGDLRKADWIGSIIKGSPAVTYYFPYKYKIRVSSDPNSLPGEYTMVLRLAEQYLIRAEARLLGSHHDATGALSDLNTIRHRAGLGDYSGPQSQDSVLQAINHERQVEFFAEWGHRWFDLARTHTITPVMSIVTPLKGGSWDPSGYQQLLPIPQIERSNNSNLTQNPGYN